MIKVILFDCDGVLVDGERFSDRYMEEFDATEEDMMPFFKEPFTRSLRGKSDLKEELQDGWLARWNWKGSASELLDYWFHIGDKENKELIDSIKRIQEKGITCVLATNQEKYRIKYLDDKIGFRDIFDEVYVSYKIGHKKPKPEFFNNVLDDLKKKISDLKKDEVLLWDDRPEYVAGAKEYGIQAEVFTDNESYKKKMGELGLL